MLWLCFHCRTDSAVDTFCHSRLITLHAVWFPNWYVRRWVCSLFGILTSFRNIVLSLVHVYCGRFYFVHRKTFQRIIPDWSHVRRCTHRLGPQLKQWLEAECRPLEKFYQTHDESTWLCRIVITKILLLLSLQTTNNASVIAIKHWPIKCYYTLKNYQNFHQTYRSVRQNVMFSRTREKKGFVTVKQKGNKMLQLRLGFSTCKNVL